jgi:hypothetical protein
VTVEIERAVRAPVEERVVRGEAGLPGHYEG